MNRSVWLGAGLLVIGILLGTAIGHLAFPVTKTVTVTKPVTTTRTLAPVRTLVYRAGGSAVTISYGLEGFRFAAGDGGFEVRLSRDGKTAAVSIVPAPAPTGVTAAVKLRLLDASGRVLAEGTALVKVEEKALKTAVPLGWYTEPDPARVTVIEVEISYSK